MKLMILCFALILGMTACGKPESLDRMDCCSHPECACPGESSCDCN